MGTGGGGNYSYAVTFVSQFGETPAGPYSAYGVTATGSMTVTGIPVSSDVGVTARNLYRTTEGGAAPGEFLVTLNDNVTTTYTDVSNDSDLGSNPPLTNTASSYTIIRGHVSFSNPILTSTSFMNASGTSWDTANSVAIADTAFVFNASPINGVTLPIVDGDTTIIGEQITISNRDPVQALNVWPNYGANDAIDTILSPSPYVIPPASSKTFIVALPGLWFAT
jgi:hypothetical protein